MFCTKCGSQIADGSKFCYVCGAKHESAVDNSPAQFVAAAENAQVQYATVADNAQAQLNVIGDGGVDQEQVDAFDATISISAFPQNNAPEVGFNDGNLENDFNQLQNGGFGNDFVQNVNADFGQMPMPSGEYGQVDNFDATVSISNFGQAAVQDYNIGFDANVQADNGAFDSNPVDLTYENVSSLYNNQNDSGATISLMEYNNDSNINNLYEAAIADGGEMTQRLDISNVAAWPAMDEAGANVETESVNQVYPKSNSYSDSVSNGFEEVASNSHINSVNNDYVDSTPTPTSSKKKKGLPAGAIIGIIAGGLLLLGGLGIGGYFIATSIINDGGSSTPSPNTSAVGDATNKPDSDDNNSGDDTATNNSPAEVKVEPGKMLAEFSDENWENGVSLFDGGRTLLFDYSDELLKKLEGNNFIVCGGKELYIATYAVNGEWVEVSVDQDASVCAYPAELEYRYEKVTFSVSTFTDENWTSGILNSGHDTVLFEYSDRLAAVARGASVIKWNGEAYFISGCDINEQWINVHITSDGLGLAGATSVEFE